MNAFGCQQTSADVVVVLIYERVRMSADICRCCSSAHLWTRSDVSRHLQMSADISRCCSGAHLWARSDVSRHLQMSADICRCCSGAHLWTRSGNKLKSSHDLHEQSFWDVRKRIESTGCVSVADNDDGVSSAGARIDLTRTLATIYS